MNLKQIEEKISHNKRIDAAEALFLFENADLLQIGYLADAKKSFLHPESWVTFVSDRNINYTNVCISGCRFCAFYRPPGHKEGYVLTEPELFQKIKETLDLGGTQILLQGGMHPDLNLNYYENLLRAIKNNFSIHIHGLSPPEIFFLSQKTPLPVAEVIKRLIRAGLDTIPGGGAEILCDDIRKEISPNKCTAAQWLDVMKTAHQLGMKTTATMMFGHIETNRHIIEHMIKLRDLQDETQGFTAFIPWTFQPKNTRIQLESASAAQYLRVLALSRLVLDNFKNIQASWVTQGDKIAQMALAFGANDFGSTMIEENVVAAAGVNFRLPKSEIIRLIQDAGYAAKQRDCFYNIINASEL
ncbi:MAG: dehypoxanthine futalosine cyclase [Desulfobacterales bacterium]|jgi:cyclic dehypoxanthinyl futalosine synthase|nr:dehypoxanthine futalosine cyclase [Desulfobacterales bacterium]